MNTPHELPNPNPAALPSPALNSPLQTPHSPLQTENTPSSEQSVAPQPLPGEQPRAESEQPPSTTRSCADTAEQTLEDTDPARAAYLAHLLSERTNRSPLDDYSPERQKTLYELLQDHPSTVVVQLLAQPEPLGWDLLISSASLRRFKTRYRNQQQAAEHDAAAREAAHVLRQAQDPNTPAFLDATQRLLKIRLFQAASDPESQVTEIQSLSRVIDRHRRTDLAERRLPHPQPAAPPETP